MGHWYSQDGKPMHFVGRGPLSRPTTLRDARRLNLAPSVTEVTQAVLAAGGLERWKVTQAILSALTLPRHETDTDEAFVERVRHDSGKQARDAAAKGDAIHKAIERAVGGSPVLGEHAETAHACMALLRAEFPDVSDWVSEHTVSHPLGFGGTVDLHSPSTGIVIDFKGKDFAPDDDKRFAYSQNIQLAAYREALTLQGRSHDQARCLNIFFSRTHPGAFYTHEWEPEAIDAGWAIFQHALAIWQIQRKYRPTWGT